jgi:hypothetical protein
MIDCYMSKDIYMDDKSINVDDKYGDLEMYQHSDGDISCKINEGRETTHFNLTREQAIAISKWLQYKGYK